MSTHWRMLLLLLPAGLIAQSRTVAAEHPAPTPAEVDGACTPEPGHWRPGYWDFGPDGSWLNGYVVCPMARFSGREASSRPDANRERRQRERLPPAQPAAADSALR
jgi:hypothetical protein